jgi:hypothetical protein
LGYVGGFKTIAKIIFDRLFFAPPFMLLTACILQYLQHFNVAKTLSYVKNSYWKLLIQNEKIWTLAHAINMEVIPGDYQDYFLTAVRLGWRTVLSLAV